MRNSTDNKILEQLIKRIEDDLEKDSIRFNPEKYYDVIQKYGTSEKLEEIINGFHPPLNFGSSLYTSIDKNIGVICDEFMYHSLNNTANIHYIPYVDDLTVNKDLDVLLVVSSCKGIDNSWQYLANPELQTESIIGID